MCGDGPCDVDTGGAQRGQSDVPRVSAAALALFRVGERRRGARRRAAVRLAAREAADRVAFQREFDERRAEARRLALELRESGYCEEVPFHVSRPLAPWERRASRPSMAAHAISKPAAITSRRARVAVIAMRSGGECSARICARKWGSEFAFRWDPRWGYDDGG